MVKLINEGKDNSDAMLDALVKACKQVYDKEWDKKSEKEQRDIIMGFIKQAADNAKKSKKESMNTRRRSRRMNEEAKQDVDNERYYDSLERIMSVKAEFDHLRNSCNKTADLCYDIYDKLNDSNNADDFGYFQQIYKDLRHIQNRLIELEHEEDEIHKELVDILYN